MIITIITIIIIIIFINIIIIWLLGSQGLDKQLELASGRSKAASERSST